MQELLGAFGEHKNAIRSWLSNARDKWRDENDTLFELLFCLCTPQSKAPICRAAINRMKEKGFLKTNSLLSASHDISEHLVGVRFPNNKAGYIKEAQTKFATLYQKVKELHDQSLALREWLVKNVKGYGYKEASHFLRNIGLGEELAILDVHILRELTNAGVIDKSVGTKGGLSPRLYLETEKKFIELAKKTGLKPAELDIAIWLKRSENTEIM